MAIVRNGKTTSIDSTGGGFTASDVSHTVTAGATLLICTFTAVANETISAVNWNVSGDEAMTLIRSSVGADSGDMGVWSYGLVNPTSGAGTLTVTHSSATHTQVSAIDYSGTIATSVALATNYLNEHIISSAGGGDNIHSGTGQTTGSTLFINAAIYGGDNATPVSSATGSFSQIENSRTGTDTGTDHGFYSADKVGGGGSQAITLTWAYIDENTGHLFEIFVASGGGGGGTGAAPFDRPFKGRLGGPI